eukprot:g48179.t1
MGDRPLRELEHGDGSSRALAQHPTLAAGLQEPTQDKTSQDDLEKELQNEADRLWADIQSKPAALPPEAYKQLAKAKKELEQGNRQGAVEILKDGARGLVQRSVIPSRVLHGIGWENTCGLYILGLCHREISSNYAGATASARPFVEDPFYYFQELAQLLERVPAQDKEAFLARSRNAPETSLLWRLCSEASRRTVNPEAGGTIPRVQRERNDQRTGPDQQ